MVLKTYKEPRLGIISLCEYQSASAVRRNTIIKNAKEVPSYIVRRYNEAEDFLTHFLIAKGDSRFLMDHIHSLRNSYYDKQSDKDCAHSCADALEGFLQKGFWFNSFLDQFALECSLPYAHNKMIIKGVQVSIRPELILRAKDGRQQLGFVKLYFSKSKPLTQMMGELITCVGKHYYMEEYNMVFKENNCLVFDVFRGQLYAAPRAFKKRMSDVNASCSEIADRWHLVK